MTRNWTRRAILGTASRGALLGLVPGLLGPRHANAADTTLILVEGGGPWLEAAQKLASSQDKVDVLWEITGSGAAILAKVKATWPNAKYDILPAWDATYHSLIKEGWLSPFTYEDVPNLRDIPSELLFKNPAGEIINVPRSIAAFFWGYRTDTAPFAIEKIDDLLDPRLRGQICWPEPAMNTNTQIVSLALARGGNERNMEPGWEFLTELAKSGNIGRVARSDVEFINSLTSAETSVSFWNQGGWGTVKRDFPCNFLTKVSGDAALKTFLYQEGWVLLDSSKHKGEAKELLNFFISPENNEAYNGIIGQSPVNVNSKAPSGLEHVTFSKEEFTNFTYIPDWSQLSADLDASVKRWETDIAPLL